MLRSWTVWEMVVSLSVCSVGVGWTLGLSVWVNGMVERYESKDFDRRSGAVIGREA